MDRAVRRAAACGDQARPLRAGVRAGAGRASRRDRRHREQPRRAGFRQHCGGAGAVGAAAQPREQCLLCARGRRHERRDPGDRARHGAAPRPPLERDPPQRGAVRPDRFAASARRRPRPDARAGAGAGALPRALPPRRRRARCRRQGAAEGDRRPARQPRHGVRPERARRRAGLHAAARRGGSCRPAGFCARRGARRCRGAGARRPRGDLEPLQRRAVPPVLRPARTAREGVPRLDRARRQRRGDRQQRDHRRADRAARREGAAARLPELRGLPARRHHGEDAGGRDRAARCRLGAGAPPRG